MGVEAYVNVQGYRHGCCGAKFGTYVLHVVICAKDKTRKRVHAGYYFLLVQ